MRKRVLLGFACVLAVSWLVFGLFFSAISRFSLAGFFTGIRLAPVFALSGAKQLVFGSGAFERLDHKQAVPVLREAFGRGIRPSDGRMLHDFIVGRGYKRALDVGTAEGYAALWFALAMTMTGGKVTTIEIDPQIATEARGNFRRAGLAGIIDSKINDALAEIPSLPGDFDFVFIDTGVPGMNKKVLDLIYPRLRPGGAIAAHNAYGFSATDPLFLKEIETDPNLATRVVPTINGGISITIKAK